MKNSKESLNAKINFSYGCKYSYRHRSHNALYPIGLGLAGTGGDVSFISYCGSEASHQRIIEERHRSELCTLYMCENPDKFHLQRLRTGSSKLQRPAVRLTVDYAEDLIFCQNIYQVLKKPDELIKVEEIVEFWDRNPILRKPLEEIGIDSGHGRVWK